MGKRTREQWSMPEPNKREYTFRNELGTLLNRHSREHSSNMPDFILADFLANCLQAFDEAMAEHNRWYDPKNAWEYVAEDSPANVPVNHEDTATDG